MKTYYNFNDSFKDITSGNIKIKNSEYLSHGKYPIVDQGKELIGGYSNIDNTVKRKGEVIIFGDHTGVFKYIDFDFLLGADGVKVIQPDYNILYPKYAYYILQKSELPKTGYDRKFKYLKRIQIPLPPLPTQQKIAAILDAADSYRQHTKTLIEKYDQLAQALFIDMFGDPINNPKKWKVKSLKEISTQICSGNTPKGGSQVYVSKGITFFRSQNVWRNEIKLEDVAFIDAETHDSMKKTSLLHRDILMTKTGRFNTENSSLGRAAMFLGEDNSANINGHVYLIRLKNNVINEYVLFVITTNQYREYIRKICVGGIDKRQLNKNHLEEFPIIFPPLDKQQKFVDKYLKITAQKQQAQSALQHAETLFQCLLQRAFKGQLG